MTIISHNLTDKIDEKTVALLSEIDAIAQHLKLAFIIVGATARDILLQHAVSVLVREAASSQGHKIAMDVLRQDAFQKESYEQVVEYFNALPRGLLD